MRLIFLGPPGSGKGTQAKLLGQRLGLVHISTGDILRDAVARDIPEGRLARPFMTAGQLVPDELVNDIINARFRSPDRPLNFVMDGYPRTLSQALSFDAVLAEQALALDAVVSLKVEDEEIVRRLGGRWTCVNPACKATYHSISRPPRTPGRCDLCNQLLSQRADDKPETIRQRLQVFHKTHDAMLHHYQARGLLVEVIGQGDIETIYASIVKALGR